MCWLPIQRDRREKLRHGAGWDRMVEWDGDMGFTLSFHFHLLRFLFFFFFFSICGTYFAYEASGCFSL
jgi:hypothetical protein